MHLASYQIFFHTMFCSIQPWKNFTFLSKGYRSSYSHLFIHPDKKSGHALKEEENNSVQGNLKLSVIVLMIRETSELQC